MKRSVRRGLAGVAAVATAITLFGCASSPSGDGGGGGSSDTITLMNWEALKGSPYEAVFKQFTADTGIKIEYQFSASGSDYWPKTRTVLGSNNPPDLMRIDDDFLPAYAATGRLQNLDDYIKSSKVDSADYYDSVFNNGKQPDGSIVGWSLGIQPRVIYYNKTMFEKAGLPLPPTTWSKEGWTWDDFLADAKALSVDGKQWGADLIDDSGFEMIFPVNNGGTGRWSKDGKSFTLADKKDAEAVQWVADLTCKYDAQPAWSDLLQTGRGQELFAGGQVGMIERVSGIASYFESNIKDFDWDIAPMPGNVEQKTYGNQIVFAIPAAAKHKDAAWKLLNYLTTMPGGKVFADQGSFVPGFKPAAALITNPTDGSSPANLGLVLDAADNSVLPGKILNAEEALQVYRPALDPVRNCQAQASDVLSGVRDQVESIIK